MSPEFWAAQLGEINNQYMAALIEMFQNISNNNHVSLKDERDKFCHKLQVLKPAQFQFGNFIAMTNLCDELFTSQNTIYWYHKFDCDDHGSRCQNVGKSCYIFGGTYHYPSLKAWMNDEFLSDEVMNKCNRCEKETYMYYDFQRKPEILLFDITDSENLTINIAFKLDVDNERFRYTYGSQK